MDKTTTRRAVISAGYKNKGITALCPIGHLITHIHTGPGTGFAGGMMEAELSAHAAGKPNWFDRQAEMCDGAGH